MQQIVQSRCDSAKQQFGQITPPDVTGTDFVYSVGANVQSFVAQGAERVRSEKSERARNAANQRHAKKKMMMRADRYGSSPIDSDGEGDNGGKKANYREKNRLAAAKCRAKKDNTHDTEVNHRKLSATNSALRKEAQDLRGELTNSRTHALNHQDCSRLISRYNSNQAKKAALGADNPSPSIPFHGGGISLSIMQSPPGMGMPAHANPFSNPE